MARYSVLRLMIFFGLLCALWLLGLRDTGERWWLLGLSAIGSMVVSYFVLKGPREQFSATIAHRVDEHARRVGHSAEDEVAEDEAVSDEGVAGEVVAPSDAEDSARS
jgi:hypothetical protein